MRFLAMVTFLNCIICRRYDCGAIKRDDEILRLYALGTPIADIARTVGCSRPTVYKVISYVPFD